MASQFSIVHFTCVNKLMNHKMDGLLTEACGFHLSNIGLDFVYRKFRNKIIQIQKKNKFL